MISVDEALARVFELLRVLEVEMVPLAQAGGRVLAGPVSARRDQPPFRASAMDGYAVLDTDVRPGASLRVIGEAAAGRGFAGTIAPGTCVRIFTGAPVPKGADRVIIQEDVTRDADRIIVGERLDNAAYIRPVGADFKAGMRLDAPKLLRPADIALIAAMNIPEIPVTRRPIVALIATGDELVMPGETPGEDQIIASNTFGLQAMFEAAGAYVRVLPIARDTLASLTTILNLAADADLIVTIGGASVGDHDLVAKAGENLGMQRAFYKIAMRPGKPLMAGRLGKSVMLGLPGNPVSSMVCGRLFGVPAILAMLGLGQHSAPRQSATLASNLAANGPREHYMRAHVTRAGITPCARQDSALLSVLADANALLVRPPQDGPRKIGESVDYVSI